MAEQGASESRCAAVNDRSICEKTPGHTGVHHDPFTHRAWVNVSQKAERSEP